MFLLPISVSYAKTTIIVSHTHVETHPEHVGMVAFKNFIESRAGDRFEVKIHPDSQLGSNEDVISKVKSGDVQMLLISSSALEYYNSIYGFFSIPYLFYSEALYEQFISDPEVIRYLGSNHKKDKFIPLVAFTAGTRNFYSKTPIKEVADLKDKKMRVQVGAINTRMVTAFGAEAIPMTFGEVLPALKNGIIDGAENNELALIDQEHGKVCRYYTYDKHQMSPDLVVGSEKFISSLSKKDLKLIDEGLKTAQQVEFNLWHKRVDEAKAQAKDMGVEFLDVNSHEFLEPILPLHEQLLENSPIFKPLYEKAVNNTPIFK